MEVFLLAVALLALFVLAGLLYQAVGSAADRRKFPPPGRMVDIGGRRLHLLEAGQGSPTVVFESGIAASCLNWTAIQAQAARFTRACSYDRAWLGWSDPAPTPRVISPLVDELHSLLEAARIPAPYILVGHSFGGLIVQAFSVAHPEAVAGLVLIDPLPAKDWLRLSREQSRLLRWGVTLSRRGALLARLGVVRATLAMLLGGSRTIPKLVAWLTSGRAESTLTRLVGEVQKMPPEVWPMVHAHWCQPKAFLGMAEYFKALPASSAEAAAFADHPPIPISILSASNSTAAQRTERDAMARRSPRGKHILVRDSGHWVHLDQPQVVIEAIHEMVDYACHCAG